MLNKFIMLIPGRTGSSFLLEKMKEHPNIHMEGEILDEFLNEPDLKISIDKQINKAKSFYMKPQRPETTAVGFKTKLNDKKWDSKGLEKFKESLTETGVAKAILLLRKNIVKSVISSIRAWKLFEKFGIWNVSQETQKVEALEVDIERFEDVLKKFLRWNERIINFANDLKCSKLTIYYEYLFNRTESSLETIYEFLEVPYIVTSTEMRKHTPDDLTRVISNFSELVSFYKGTTYEKMFYEVPHVKGKKTLVNKPMASTPKVSVIIPCYNQGQYLTEAVGSVLKQTFTDYEIIIVNDGSTDNSKEIAESLISSNPGKQIFLINQNNHGLPATRNNGIRESRGRYILPLDADDMILPEMLQKTVFLLDSEPSIPIAYTDVIKFGVVNENIKQMEYDFNKLLYQNHLFGTSLFRKEVWESVGGYNTKPCGYEDWDFWISCGEKGFYAKRIPEFLILYRIKEKSMHTEALKRDKELRAIITLIHPNLYPKDEVNEAKQLLDNITPECSLIKQKYDLYYFYTDKGFDKDKKYVLLFGGFTGYQNFGDILQLKYAIGFHEKSTSLTPVVLCDIECLTDECFKDKLYDNLGVEYIIFYSKTFYNAEKLPVSIINEPTNIQYFHIYGGGFLNEFWVDYYISLVSCVLEYFGVGHYLFSGQQIDSKGIEKLKVLFDKYKPVLIGCRDEDSYESVKKIAPEFAKYSFDDAFECMCDIARHIKTVKENHEQTQTILLHFNLTSYIHGTTARNALGIYKYALDGIKRHFKEKKIKVILLIAFNDSRVPTVLDSPAVLQALEDSFDFRDVRIINLANIAFSYHPDTQEGYFFEVPDTSVMFTSSYHTAMLGLSLKIPTFLFSENTYYKQKHKGLHMREKDLGRFLINLSGTETENELDYFRDARKKWHDKLKEAYTKVPEPRPCKYKPYDETEMKEFTYKFEKYDLQTVLHNTHAHIRNLEHTLAQKNEELKKKEKQIQNLETAITQTKFAAPDIVKSSALGGEASPALRKASIEDGPLVSVIMPTYNRPEMLKEALKSVLNQTYKNYEIIVINDAGEDVSEIIDSLNVKGKIVYLRHKENKGLSTARNTALKAAKGKYIAYLDDDDVYYPNHLGTLIGSLETKNCQVAYTDAYQAFQVWITDKYVTTEKSVTYSFDFDKNRLLVSNYIHISTIAHRKDLINQVGCFDKDLDVHEDWEFFIRLSQYCEFFHIKVVTAEFRTRKDGTNMTTGNRMPFLRTLRIIHSRYSHLVKDLHILEDQKRVEKSLNIEVESGNENSCITHYEHLHRYKFVTEFARGKNVLDLGCSDGYGSFLLAEEAESVTGVSMNTKTIKHASSMYIKKNLEFIKGPITDIPIKEEKIFDVIVCFGALEYAEQHDELMREVKRLIKDDGMFVASIPNKGMCSEPPDYQPFSLNGLYLDEFKALLANNFENTIIFGQKVFPSSNIFNLSMGGGHIKEFAIEKGDKEFLFVPPEKREARYFVAVSSNSPISNDVMHNSHLVDISETLFKQNDTRLDYYEETTIERNLYVKNLEGSIKDNDTHIRNLENSIKDKDAHIGNLENAIKDKDSHIGNLENAIKDKDSHIGNLENTIKDKKTRIDIFEIETRDKDAHICNLEDKVRDKDTHIHNLEATIRSKTD